MFKQSELLTQVKSLKFILITIDKLASSNYGAKHRDDGFSSFHPFRDSLRVSTGVQIVLI